MSKTAMVIISTLLICLLLTSCASSGISANSPDTTDPTDASKPTTLLEPLDYHDNILYDYTDTYAGVNYMELKIGSTYSESFFHLYLHVFFTDANGNPAAIRYDENNLILEYLIFDKDKMDRSFTSVLQLMNDVAYYSPVSLYEIISLFGVPSHGGGSLNLYLKSSGDDGYFIWYCDLDNNIGQIDYHSNTITEITEEAFVAISLGISESEVIRILGNPQSCWANDTGKYCFEYKLVNSDSDRVRLYFEPDSDGILRVSEIKIVE